MRKLDNISFLATIGGGAAGAVGLTTFGLTINPLLSIQAFIATFGAISIGGFAITMISQFEIRDEEEAVRNSDLLAKKMTLLERGRALDIYESKLMALDNKVSKELSELEKKSNDKIEDADAEGDFHTRFKKRFPQYSEGSD